MMRILIALSLVLVMAPASPLRAQEIVDIDDLDLRPRNHQGEEVSITGELIGDYGHRGDGIWVQLNGDPYVTEPLEEGGQLVGGNAGIGVRIPLSLFDQSWGDPGRYRTRGPIVTVTGIFRYNDPDTGGETFIDATRIELVEPSRPIEIDPADTTIAIVGIVLLILGVGAFGYAHWWRDRPR